MRSLTPSSMLLLVFLVLCSITAQAAPNLEISSYQLQSTKRISLSVYEYTYQVRATNRGTAAAGAEARVQALRDWIVPQNASLYFGNVGAGATVTSSDLLVIRHDRRRAFGTGDIVWNFTASDATFTGRFEGPTSKIIVPSLVTYVDDRPYAQNAVSTNADGQRVLRTDLSIILAADAIVGSIQPALDAVQATVIATLAGRRQIVVRIPDPGSLPALETIRAGLAAVPGIARVSYSIFPRVAVLPPNVRFRPGVTSPPPNPDDLSTYLAHHLAIRGHAAWNIADRFNAPSAGTGLVEVPLLVIADFFGNGPPTIADGFNLSLNARDFATGRVSPDGPYHGYSTLSVVAASFGGDDSQLGLSTGLVPAVPSRVILQAVDLTMFGPDQTLAKTVQILLASSFARKVVLNTSLATIDEQCCDVPSAAHKSLVEEEAVKWIRLIRGEGPAAVSLESRFLHVTSAGNNPNGLASEVSLYAHAGVQTTVIDRGLLPLAIDDTAVPGLTNVLVVEGRFANSQNPSVQPPVVGCPNGENSGSSPGYFSRGGNISAIGSVQRAVNQGIFLPYRIVKSGIGSSLAQGSSIATPQAAGLALYAWALKPELTPQAVKGLLLRTAVRNQAGPNFPQSGSEGPAPPPDFNCPGPAGYQTTIDAYATVLATDEPTGLSNLSRAAIAPARLTLLDVASVVGAALADQPDGKFTQADILKFLQQFEAAQGKRLDYSRYDLNGNGRTGEVYVGTDVIERRRFDLDGNFTWTTAPQTVEGRVVNFDESFAADISVLVHYAYSPLYTGNEYERTILLLPYLRVMNNPVAFLTGLAINVRGIRATTFSLSQIQDQTTTFRSLCGGGERGAYSQVVVDTAHNNFSSTEPTFWQPLNQLGRIADQQATATNCSSFIATIGSSGKVWINSASRTTNASGQDIEYQSRFDLGEPDLTEGPAGSMTPPPKRLATQALTYGTVDSPGGGFHPIANTRDFTLRPIDIGVQ